VIFSLDLLAMATEKQKLDAALHREHLMEQVKKRGYARFKGEIFNHGIIPVAVIIATGVCTIAFFTYRLLTQNNTIAYELSLSLFLSLTLSFTRHGVRSFFWFTPKGHLIQSEEHKQLVKAHKEKEKDYLMTHAYGDIVSEQKHTANRQ
jgi:hypothetical protein